MKTFSLVLLTLLAACSGSSKPKPVVVSTPTEPRPPLSAAPDAPSAIPVEPADTEDDEDAAEAQNAAINAEVDAAVARMAALDELREAELVAYEAAKPVFVKYCAACHTSSGKKTSPKKLEHFDMSSYPYSGEDGAELDEEVRKSLGLRGKKASMPKDKPGLVQGAELQLLVNWAEAYDANHTSGDGE